MQPPRPPDDRSPPPADVYAGDTSTIRPADGSDRQVYTYTIEADADPDVLSRIAGVCNLANVAPRRVLFERGPRGGVAALVELSGIGETTADSIRRKLRQLTSVTAVSMALANSSTPPT